MPYSLLSNSPVSGQIAWSDVRLVYDGVDYVIANGTTNKRFVYWLKSTPSAFQVADALPALGPDDTVVFLNKNGIAINVLNATALEGDLVVPGTITSNAIATNAIDATHIKSDAILARHILAGSVTADKITVDSLRALSANMGDLTSGTITVDQAGFIRGGASAYGSGTGFWMGYHSGAYKWRVGTPGSSGAEWDGNSFNVYGPDGSVTISSGIVDWIKISGTGKPIDNSGRVIDGERTTNPSPADFPPGETFYFKQSSSVGVTGAGTFGVLRTVRPYGTGADLSGGGVFQWFEAEQLVWARKSTSATAWSSWQRVPNETITSSNVTTYIANAAIGNAQIANAAITAAKIDDLQVTSAKIANAAITNAKIGNAAVDTLQIAGQAVTIPISGQTTTATLTLSSADFEGGKVQIILEYKVTGSANSGEKLYCQIRRNGTAIKTYSITYPAQDSGGHTLEGIGLHLDSPGSGSVVYSFHCYKDNPSYGVLTPHYIRAVVLGAKR